MAHAKRQMARAKHAEGTHAGAARLSCHNSDNAACRGQAEQGLRTRGRGLHTGGRATPHGAEPRAGGVRGEATRQGPGLGAGEGDAGGWDQGRGAAPPRAGAGVGEGRR
jgi:hypothetical protein